MSQSIEKAPKEAATSVQGAQELVQGQNTTALKANQVPDEILYELAAMQKRFREIYRETGLTAISDEDVQLNEEAFLATFSAYELKARECEEYPEKLFTEFAEVRFFCIR